MGNFSKDRLPEMVLRVIYQFMLDAGLRAPINASLKTGAHVDSNTTYTLTVFNDGVAQQGLDAEEVAIFLKNPLQEPSSSAPPGLDSRMFDHSHS